MMNTQNIVILGGSYAGISTAHYLLKHAIPQLPEPSGYRIVLVSLSSEILCRPACPRAMISDHLLDQSKLFVPVAAQFDQYSHVMFTFVQGEAKGLDSATRTVTIVRKDGTRDVLPFAALVIATGSSTPSSLFSMDQDSQTLRDSWESLRETMGSARSIVIAGGGPTGVETAGELGEYLNGRPGWFSGTTTKQPAVDVKLVTGAQQILPYLPDKVANKAASYLSAVGVTVLTRTRVEAVEPAECGTKLDVDARVTITLSNGQVLKPDIYIPSTGVHPNTSFIPPELLTDSGHVDTCKSSLRVNHAGPRIYAIGDVASYARPAVHITLDAVPVLCNNIKRDLFLALGDTVGAGEDRQFKEDTGVTQMVTIGQSKGVGVVKGWPLPSFLVWLIKGRDYFLWTTENIWNGKQWKKEL